LFLTQRMKPGRVALSPVIPPNSQVYLYIISEGISMKPMLIRGGWVIDPGQGINGPGSLLITDGQISRLETGDIALPHTDYDVLHAEGMVVSPGFIDLHCHLREPGYENKETIATGSMAAARGGFTTICCMPNTDPPLDSTTAIDYVKYETRETGAVRVLPVGCITLGRLGEELADMKSLAGAGAIAFSDDGSPLANSRLMREALELSLSLGLYIINHPEDTTLTDGGQMNEGAAANALGLAGMPAVAEEIMVARDLALAALTGGHLHLAHVSTRGSVELIARAKEKGINVTAEVTPHHLTMTENVVTITNTSTKVNPPLRTQEDIKALIQGLKDGIIDAIATDHAPHTDADKRCDYAHAAFGISGFETAFGSLMTLVHGNQLTLSTLIARLTSEPARILGDRHGKLGTLSPGAPADITLFDPQKEWVVDTGLFASKGKNTPLNGSVLKGKIMVTIYRGKPVYKDESIKLITGVL